MLFCCLAGEPVLFMLLSGWGAMLAYVLRKFQGLSFVFCSLLNVWYIGFNGCVSCVLSLASVLQWVSRDVLHVFFVLHGCPNASKVLLRVLFCASVVLRAVLCVVFVLLAILQ